MTKTGSTVGGRAVETIRKDFPILAREFDGKPLVYLDNAASTSIDPQVAEAMMPFITGNFGNPSSTHGHGREVKSALEMARKRIADQLNCLPGEIYFTSGGTESINCVLNGVVNDLGVKHAITSPTEHHAVLHTLEHLEEKGQLEGFELDAAAMDAAMKDDLVLLKLGIRWLNATLFQEKS